MRMTLFALGLLAAGPVLAAPPQVVADTPVTASLVQQVLGDLGQVQVLLPKGSSAHHHQMRASDARALQEAGLLVWTGPGLTPWLERAASSVAGDVAQLRLLEVPGTHLREYGAGHEGHAEGDHDHAPDGEPDPGHADVDPHAWLDPANARIWVTAIADALAEADPGNAEAYRRNAAAAAGGIDSLDRDLRARLQPHAKQGFVVFHDAYGYFTDHFGLTPAIAVTLGDATAPSAARLDEIRARIARSGAACAFPEQGSDPRLVEAAIEGSPVRIGQPLSPEGSDLEAGPQLYGQVMTRMADAIEDCLAG